MAPAPPITLESQTAAERVTHLFSYVPITLAGNAAAALVISSLMWEQAPRAQMLAWMGVFWLFFAVRLVAYRRFVGQRPQQPEALQRWYRAWALGTLISGVLWGAAAWMFYGYGGVTERVGLLLSIYSLCVAAVPIFAPRAKVFNAFICLCFVPMMAKVVLPGTLDGFLLAGVLLTMLGMTVLLARSYRTVFDDVLLLKVRADHLTVQLRAEKEAADAARLQAEVANRAKTQFFAAASHDLRQPLHAMGLFAEALRQRSHDEEVTHLVTSINGSVDALEELFSELLDITKIDSGGVEPAPEHFSIGDVFRKLRLHFEPAAFEKGLSLRFRGGTHNVHADPVLVERILRNLVSNAIRYTNDGSILVSCRRRAGALLLQVWDTGVGISEREQAHIFEEFYQVPYSEALSPQQRKGLGLGLAIVKRLADLMGSDLSLRSQSGRGTVFTLQVAQGKTPRAAAPAFARMGALGLTLEGRHIVMVEDEPAVRGGLEALLKQWGATVASFETVAATMAWANTSNADAAIPDLLIVDYRLEQGRTGVEAITALRQRFGAHLPAIVVTGSTMTGHDAEAQTHDFHLLVKPVVPNKLRAMIGFKLGVRGA